MKKRNEEVTFKDILDVFIPKIWIIAIVSVLLAAVMGAYSALSVKDTYTTKTIFGIHPSSKAPSGDLSYIGEVVDNVRYKLFDDDFFVPIVKDINEFYEGEYEWISSAYISNTVDYNQIKNGILQISVTTNDPRLSYAISQSLETLIPPQINDVYPGYFSIEVYDKPDATPAANPKGTAKKTILGFAVGAVISAAAVWLYSALDMVVRNRKKIEDYFDIPVIAVIPLHNADNETEAFENV